MSKYNKSHAERAKLWAAQSQPDIDSIRTTGKPLDRGPWEGVKHWGNGIYQEFALDANELLGYPSWERSRLGYETQDDRRNKSVEEEKAKALRDYNSRSLPETELRKNPIGPTSSWQKLIGEGDY